MIGGQIKYRVVSRKIRLQNFVIDLMAFFPLAYIIGQTAKNFFGPTTIFWVLLVMYFMYYFVLELLIGQTFGKIVTSTVVVGKDFKSISPTQALIRTLLRLLPLNVFYSMNHRKCLHDKWSDTLVVYR